jgi:8-oxo-dGTP diphosphatase
MTKQIVVVGAVIVRSGKILCARRAPGTTLGGMWEFPGGKVEPAEAPEDALAREIDEELGCTIGVGPKITTTSHPYDFGTVHLTTYYCSVTHGDPRPHEHSELAWLTPDELSTKEWAPADIPAVQMIEADFADDRVV